MSWEMRSMRSARAAFASPPSDPWVLFLASWLMVDHAKGKQSEGSCTRPLFESRPHAPHPLFARFVQPPPSATAGGGYDGERSSRPAPVRQAADDAAGMTGSAADDAAGVMG